MSNARGFMGEPFPSQKFQRVIADYLGRDNTKQAECIGDYPPGFKRVEPEHIPKTSWDELYQENIALRAELERLNQINRADLY